MTRATRPRVGLFVTCLVDAMRPEIGFAAIRLLEDAGCDVEVPTRQTCCGQPAYNSGDDASTAAVARQVIAAFEPFDHLIVPSGSCAGTIRHGYPALLASDADWGPRAARLAEKTHEIMSYLVDIRDYTPGGLRLEGSATYHDSCAGLRELGIHDQPRRLLAAVDGLEMRPLDGENVCCGFGGMFCVKYPAISDAIVGEKADTVERSGADMLLAGDLGCLMNMAGKLNRRGSKVRCFHTIEILAGGGNGPAIGEKP
ncbi:(Fe-S)-binding protein [Jannaschia rubra]|uniref:Lactate utilization protein A n=1 Tax=Jannaschia rubra TaxID=282197 RepID=A0A0M6XKQ5_9RHOB|nr:(Fe-S)-binding protein [Jannaschia rubra]CTQ31679.1 Lactate utilization protein A [Jannaschia rubra]SFG82322.1 L-lactate dehydrogenase complex protein LldE [Jannaschia rubra]